MEYSPLIFLSQKDKSYLYNVKSDNIEEILLFSLKDIEKLIFLDRETVLVYDHFTLLRLQNPYNGKIIQELNINYKNLDYLPKETKFGYTNAIKNDLYYNQKSPIKYIVFRSNDNNDDSKDKYNLYKYENNRLTKSTLEIPLGMSLFTFRDKYIVIRYDTESRIYDAETNRLFKTIKTDLIGSASPEGHILFTNSAGVRNIELKLWSIEKSDFIIEYEMKENIFLYRDLIYIPGRLFVLVNDYIYMIQFKDNKKILTKIVVYHEELTIREEIVNRGRRYNKIDSFSYLGGDYLLIGRKNKYYLYDFVVKEYLGSRRVTMISNIKLITKDKVFMGDSIHNLANGREIVEKDVKVFNISNFSDIPIRFIPLDIRRIILGLI